MRKSEDKVIPKRLLVLDDRPALIEMMNEVLEYEGYELVHCPDVSKFFGQVKQEPPDLVIIDYLLPEVNGGELCRQLKIYQETAHIPVILMSAYPHIIKCDYSADAFIEKPFSIDELIGTIGQLLPVPGV